MTIRSIRWYFGSLHPEILELEGFLFLNLERITMRFGSPWYSFLSPLLLLFHLGGGIQFPWGYMDGKSLCRHWHWIPPEQVITAQLPVELSNQIMYCH